MKMEIANKRLEMFLKELAELTNKHGFSICGCGCCGSPWIEDVDGKTVWEGLYYDAIKKKYE
jgi:hypothetical protein